MTDEQPMSIQAPRHEEKPIDKFFRAAIKACQEEGMLDLTDNLCQYIRDGVVDPREAFKHAPNEEELRMALKGIKTASSGIL